MNAERVRPLAAVALLALVCAVIMIEGMRAGGFPSTGGSPAGRSPSAVDGAVLTGRPTDSASPRGTGASPIGVVKTGSPSGTATGSPPGTTTGSSSAHPKVTGSGGSSTGAVPARSSGGDDTDQSWVTKWQLDRPKPTKGAHGKAKGQAKGDSAPSGKGHGAPGRGNESGQAQAEDKSSGKAQGKPSGRGRS